MVRAVTHIDTRRGEVFVFLSCKTTGTVQSDVLGIDKSVSSVEVFCDRLEEIALRDVTVRPSENNGTQ